MSTKGFHKQSSLYIYYVHIQLIYIHIYIYILYVHIQFIKYIYIYIYIVYVHIHMHTCMRISPPPIKSECSMSPGLNRADVIVPHGPRQAAQDCPQYSGERFFCPQRTGPNPTTKIGSNLGEFSYQPKWDTKTVLSHPTSVVQWPPVSFSNFFLVAAQLNWSKPKKGFQFFFSRVTEQLSHENRF